MAWKPDGLGAALLVLVTLVAYVPAMRGGFLWDDYDYVADNEALRSVRGLRAIWLEPGAGHRLKPGAIRQYYPLLYSAFWLQYRFWGQNPVGYHVVNVLLHALNAILVWRLLKRLGVGGAWVAAAVFALHPVHVESVGWITELKNCLSGAFMLLALWAYLRFSPPEEGARPPDRRWRFYALAVGLFVCALLSKSVAVTMPAVVLLLIWWKRERIRWADCLALVPLFVLAAAMGVVTVRTEHDVVGAAIAHGGLPFVGRVLVAGRALWFYAAKLVFPYPLTFVYPRWQVDVGAAWQYLFPLAVLGVMVVLYALRKRIGKGPLVGVLFFAGTLVPALGFFDVYFQMQYSYVADHFLYLSSLGLIALAAALAATLFRRLGPRRARIGPAVCGLVLVVLAALTWQQGRVYKDEETLWRDTVCKNPDAWMAHQNLGSLLARRGDLDEAATAFREVLRARPGSAVGHYSLGIVLARKGELQAAADQYAKALRIRPGYADAHLELGHVLVRKRELQAAADQYAKALRSRPGYADAHLELGRILARLGNVDAAAEHFREALRIKPDRAAAHFHLAAVLAAQGDLAEAVRHYRGAVRLDPDFAPARYGLAMALVGQGDAAGAVVQFREALRAWPDLPEALNNLAWLLATHPDPGLRDGPEAVRLAERACELADPPQASHLDTLAAACAEAGRFPEAAETAQKALRLAESAGQKDLAAEIRGRLRLYEAGRPYRAATWSRSRNLPP